MENNTKIFIEYFGKLEIILSDLIQKEYRSNHLPFYEKIEKASRESAIIRKYATPLRTFGDLRNLLAHNNNEDIATPTDQTVKEIKYIYHLLTNPPTAYHIAHKEVKKFDINDSLTEVLEVIQKERYAQYPIYDQGEFEGLLTESGIAYWLSTQLSQQSISLQRTTIEDVLVNDKKRSNYKFIPSTMDIYEIENKLADIHTEALFVTDSGNPNQKIHGIITRWDVIQQREEENYL